MYVVEVKTAFTQALRRVFDVEYPNPQFRGLKISIEYPVDKQDYPSIWIDWEPSGNLRTVGINHREYTDSDDLSATATNLRWRFAGSVTFTIASLSSLERDTLVDELVRVFAFGSESGASKQFRDYIEDNPFVALNVDFDEIAQRGWAASPGTPWQTDEIIYEATLALDVVGEFLSDDKHGLIKVDEIDVIEYSTQEPDPEPDW